MLRMFLVLALFTSAHAQPASNAVAFLEGLTNMNSMNRTPSLFLEADGIMEPADIQAYTKLMRSNPVANENARALTANLRANGSIGPNEEIIGVSDGRAIKARSDLFVTER